MTTRPTTVPGRLGAAAAVLAAGALLAACADESPTTEPGSSTPGEELEPPYGQSVELTDDLERLCGLPTNQTADFYVQGPPGDDGGAVVGDGVDDGGVAVAAGADDGGGAVAAGADDGGHAVRAGTGTGTSLPTLVPPDPGVVEDVGVEVVDPPTATSTAVEVDITLTGPEQDEPYVAEEVSVSFLAEGDDGRQWVGFVLDEDVPTRRLPFDEPVSPSPGGTTTTVTLQPLACPEEDLEVGETFEARPLADGSYVLSIYGHLEQPSGEGTQEGSSVWGQELTDVSVVDGRVEGIGYDGPNAYDD